MEKNEIVSPYRLTSIIFLLVITVLETWVLCYLNQFYIDEILSLIFLDFIFMAILIFQLEYERKIGGIGNNTETNFNRFLIGYVVACFLLVGFIYLPEFERPMLLIPILLCAFSNESLGFGTSLFLCVLMALICGSGANELITYIIEIVIGCMVSKALMDKKLKIYLCFLYFCVQIMLPCLFYYWTYKEIPNDMYFTCAIEGIVIALFSFVMYIPIVRNTQNEYKNSFTDIIQDDYPLVLEAKAYSKQEYAHCQRVSVLCYRIAKDLGYDADLCAAAGFYYRVGRRIGQPYAENGVIIAQKNCFPEPVIGILEEYEGEIKKPSTPESAIVHMVDALLIKMELFDQNLGQSHWNKDMVVYQTLNELSNTGIYDNSGLSMNQFLKLREYLVKEDHLY